MYAGNATYLSLRFNYFSMGKEKKRVNPKVTCQMNRDFKRGYMVEILRQIDKATASMGGK
jgi:hypothetical protein